MKMEILVEKVQLNHDVCKSLLLLKAFYIAFYPYALFSKKKFRIFANNNMWTF